MLPGRGFDSVIGEAVCLDKVRAKFVQEAAPGGKAYNQHPINRFGRIMPINLEFHKADNQDGEDLLNVVLYNEPPTLYTLTQRTSLFRAKAGYRMWDTEAGSKKRGRRVLSLLSAECKKPEVNSTWNLAQDPDKNQKGGGAPGGESREAPE